MKTFWQEIARHDAASPALDDLRGERRTYGELHAAIAECEADLRKLGIRRCVLDAPNGVESATLLLAVLRSEIPLVPLAPFASPEQVGHVLSSVQPNLVIAGEDSRLADICKTGFTPVRRSSGITWFVGAPTPRSERGPALITFTSGSTARPKGVCLEAGCLASTCESLVAATEMRPDGRHVCLHPFALLLELVGGLLRTLRAGACAIVPDLPAGAVCSTDGEWLVDTLRRVRATSTILVPDPASSNRCRATL